MKHRAFFLMLSLLFLTASVWAQVGSINGVVLLPGENGGPAAGATVTLYRMHHDSLSTTANDAGEFSFADVPVAFYAVVGRLDGYLPGESRVQVIENQTAEVTVHLRPLPTGLGSVAGTVFLPFEGGPAAGATVTLHREGADDLVTTTNDEGHYLFESVAVGFYMAHAELEGYLPAEARVSVMDGRTVTLNLFLRPENTGTGTVTGVVRLPGEDGGPAAGATVTLYQMMHDSLVAVANEEGQFGFEAVPVGGYVAVARLEGYLPTEFHFFLAPGQTVTLRLVLRGVPADLGAVEGTVTFANGEAAAGAMVNLEGRHHRFYRTMTNPEGQFGFRGVVEGAYTITAGMRMHGFVSQPIEVAAGQTTNVTLVLNDSIGGGHHHGDTLTVVDLEGTAIVVTPDTLHPRMVHYLLDVDNDGEGDYVLAFGPPWYQPEGGAQRPANGDQITIRGGLLTYTDPEIVVVYEINGMFWRRPFQGHGGHGGGDHHGEGCDTDSLIAIELEGTAVVHAGEGPHHERIVYGVDTDANGMPDYMLDFGRADYVPPSGAERPANGDAITIVGGQIYCPNRPMPMVIVYELNGLIWREPGDTLGLGAMDPTSVDEPVVIGAPLSYLTLANYPNPFNPVTTISYNIPITGDVKLMVYDVNGRTVATLVDRHQEAGSYAVPFDGSTVASGAYFYRLSVGGQSVAGRMLLLK